MSAEFADARLSDRAVIQVRGADWRGFLQGLLTQDVETLRSGEARFAALLTPQGRLLWDMFVIGRDDGCWLDVEADAREALIQRLNMYKLRAKLEIEAVDLPVSAYFSLRPMAGSEPPRFLEAKGPPDEVWVEDPRLPQLGLRGYGGPGNSGPRDDYDAHRLALGVPGPADWGSDRTYPIEADFDLLNGVDFQKGCFVGQETTSRMKRRGTVKSRMLPIVFEGAAPAHGAEILAGTLRAGEVLSGVEGRAMALVRLDRIDGAELTVDGRTVRVERPRWFESTPGQDAA